VDVGGLSTSSDQQIWTLRNVPGHSGNTLKAPGSRPGRPTSLTGPPVKQTVVELISNSVQRGISRLIQWFSPSMSCRTGRLESTWRSDFPPSLAPFSCSLNFLVVHNGRRQLGLGQDSKEIYFRSVCGVPPIPTSEPCRSSRRAPLPFHQ
jgi:hypothetical protein